MPRPLFSRLLMTAALACIALPAHAADSVTDASVRALYKESVDAYKLPLEGFLAKMEAITADTYKATAKTTVNIAGEKPMEQIETMDKKQSMAASAQSYAAMQSASIDTTIDSVTIAPDGKSAQVTDTTTIKGMRVPGQPVTLNGGGTCNDTVALNSAGVLQMTVSDCTMEFTVVQPPAKP